MPEQHRGNSNWMRMFKIGLTIFLTFACCLLLVFIMFRFDSISEVTGKIMSALSPIIIGLVLAYLMNPIMKFIERSVLSLFSKKADKRKAKKISMVIGITGATIILIGIIAALIAMIVPSLLTSISSLSETLPDDVENFIGKIRNGYFGDSYWAKTITNYIITFTDSIDEWATKTLLPEAQKYATQITGGVISVVRGVFNFIVGIVVMVYAMSIQKTLKGQAKKILYAAFKPDTANIVLKTFRKANKIFGGFITGKILDSLIIGIIAYIGCVILRIPSAILVAAIIGITNIIPAFGPFIGAVPSIFLVVIQSPIHALYLFIFIIVLQQIDGNIIGPKILGSSTGLSTFWVMFAILVGGGLFGFVGMLVGVPAFGVIYYIIKEFINYVLKRRQLSTQTLEYIELDTVDAATNKLVYSEKNNEKNNEKDIKKDEEKH